MKKTRHTLQSSLFAILCTTLSVSAWGSSRRSFPAYIPPSNASCLSCHTRPSGGRNALNALGIQVTQHLTDIDGQQRPDWSVLFALDADGDGYTNGVEFGDPDGQWQPSNPATTALSDPAQRNDTPCGNTTLESIEECDGANLDGATCADFDNFDEGTLGCSAECLFDFSGCSKNTCDGGAADEDEDCDGDDLKQAECSDFGFSGGTLSCNQNCTFNTSNCTTAIDPDCGDDTINNDDEKCDGEDLGGQTCISQGFASGTLSCTERCAFDTSKCQDEDINGPGQPSNNPSTDSPDAQNPTSGPEINNANESDNDSGTGCQQAPSGFLFTMLVFLMATLLQRRRNQRRI